MVRYWFCVMMCWNICYSTNYGDFNLALTKYEQCKGPKRRYCIEAKITIENSIFLKYDVYVKENMTHVKGKLSGQLNNQEMIRMPVKDICQHFFFKPLFMAMFNMQGHCGIFKGHYSFQVDAQALARKFYGGKFMYGNITIKSVFFNDDCNLYCDILHVVLYPKQTTLT